MVAIERKLKDLHDKTCQLMVVMVDNFATWNNKESRVILEATKSVEGDIKELLRCASYNFYCEMIVDC